MPDDALMPWLPVPAQVVEEVGDDVQLAGLGYLVVYGLPTARSSTPRPNGENTTVRSGGTPARPLDVVERAVEEVAVAGELFDQVR